MKKIVYLSMAALLISVAAKADEVIPSVSKADASEMQKLGKAADDSSTDSQKPAHPDNFGGKVSAAAKQMKEDGTKGGFGKWVSSQRSHRPADAGDKGKNVDARQNGMTASENARNKAGRPSDAGGGAGGQGSGHGRGN